ncbi:protein DETOXIFICATION 19-like [Andrographis paniculata]|uniref:protein DETOXIFICATION 19-like n=1 Tax=Andrographis paniculata TaxID=175694 RepID=UPI0021E7E5B4|nr:protein DETOXIFICATION 19-like [Andrographis paniculata]
MASENSADAAAATPLLEKTAEGCLNKIVDVEEAKDQIFLAVPMIVTNVSYYFIPLVSVMFAGHIGESELAAANLANSWAFVTGFDLMVGLTGALETLCGQAFGAKLHRMLGSYLQASCIVTTVFSILVSLLWWYSDIVLTLLGQDPQVSKSARLYLRYLIPGLFAYGLLQNMLKFLQTQRVVVPLVICSTIPLALQIGIRHIFSNWTSFDYGGAPLAASVSLWISVLMLALYVLKAKRFKETREGFTFPSWSFVVVDLKLALPSAAMVCLEYWAFEILVLLAGLMPNSKLSTSIIAMCVNTESIAYMIAYGLSAAASTRVSNELGAGRPDRARRATSVALKLTVILSLCIVVSLYFGHDLWAGSFSNSLTVIDAFASMTPLLLVSMVSDFVQGILSGVARGCGWQHLVVYINLGTFYLLGVPVAVLLGFKFKLYTKGLWIGLICGLTVQMIGLLVLARFTKWRTVEISPDLPSKTTVADV